jgi:tRNA(Ile)-lysidine synthase
VIVERVLERVRAGGLLREGAAHVVLVSGGRDSVCLLDVLVALADPARLHVIHVNYGLRGGASDGDELHVRSLCERYEVRCTVRRAASLPERGNLQAWARDLRYGAASQLALEDDAFVVTGHTASDQVETVLYRLAASPGRRALLGMASREGRLLRPLLSLTHEDTGDYCRARGLGWREDASNADPRFARGRVRHELLDAMRAVHPSAEANVARTAELLRDEAAVLDRIVDDVIAQRQAIPIDELRGLDRSLARLVLVRLAEAAAGGALLPAVSGRLGEITALARNGGSAALDVGDGVRALVEYGTLRFERRGRQTAPAEVALPVPGHARFGEWTLASELRAASGEQALAHRCSDGSVAVLDADRLDLGALRVRGWRAGDSISPVGLDGTKSLADLFADRHLPRAQRATTPVVVCAGEVVWVASLATASRVRVSPQTRRVALITASH